MDTKIIIPQGYNLYPIKIFTKIENVFYLIQLILQWREEQFYSNKNSRKKFRKRKKKKR